MTDHESGSADREDRPPTPPDPAATLGWAMPAGPVTPSSGPPVPPGGPVPGGTWGQPAAGAGFGAPQPPKSNRTRNIVLIVLAVVLALCCCGVGVGAFFISKAAEGIGPARDATSDFAGHLVSGDASAAYDLLCEDTQARFSREEFAQGLTTRPKITEHEIVGVNVMKNNGKTTAQVTAQLTDSSGFTDSHVFRMVREDDEWKVCGDPY